MNLEQTKQLMVSTLQKLFPNINYLNKISENKDGNITYGGSLITPKYPDDMVCDSKYVHTDNNFTDDVKNKVHDHSNKTTVLDNLSADKYDNLVFKGYTIPTRISSANYNAVQLLSDGMYVEDKTKQISIVNTKINNLRQDINEQAKFSHYVNTTLDWCNMLSTTGMLILDVGYNMLNYFELKTGNMEIVQDTTTYIRLKAGKIYRITSHIFACWNGTYHCETDKGELIGQYTYYSHNSYSTSAMSFIYQVPIDNDILICIINDTYGRIWPAYSYCNVEEVGQAIVVDPVEHIDTESGLNDTPIGSIITYLGTRAPKHYLLCDGSEYNIQEYGELANQIKDEFGSYNYFGGDGLNTFAVPDINSKEDTTEDNDTKEEVNNTEENTDEIIDTEEPITEDKSDDENETELDTDGVETEETVDTSEGDKEESNDNSDNTVVETPTDNNKKPVIPTIYCIKYESTYYMNYVNDNADTVKELQKQNRLLEEEIEDISNLLDKVNGTVVE